ncbi:amidohydrolase family protein [Martelella lutilitoris]|uniref:Amidohydrolase family protein n=1 Tax=Martelella lutilitoris TaxID=2583532 RepID=A0A5C4JWD9_9HYPH|nr:amidohydrolase family protein [Martelella lutilitoris]TNB49622.1 amidohydrolase family protein [Martelella lutilitoris]
MRAGSKYQHLIHGAGCPCHTPEFARLNKRLMDGFSRRSVLKGAAATIAAGALASMPSLAQANDRAVLLTNVRIFDGLSDALIEGRNVLVSNGRIEALIPVAEDVADADVVDCGNRVLMPGLIDAHWHSLLCAIPMQTAMTAQVPYVHLVAAAESEKTLMRGFTTVRDVGGPAFALKRAIDGGKAIGPRIYPAGAMITQTSGHGDFRMPYEIPASDNTDLSHAEEAGISSIANGVPQVLKRVREQLMLGASQIKIMTGGGVSSQYDPIPSLQFTPDEIRAAVQATEDWGTYVCAHVYTAEGIKRSIENGVACIEHGQLADEETVRMIVDTGTWWSIQPFLADEDSNPQGTEQQRQDQRNIAEGTVRCFEWADKFNIERMVWGTDILFNPAKTNSQGRQLAKLAEWFSPATVLKMATSRTGELLQLSGVRNPYRGRVGVIEAGAFADMLLIDGNPLEDISLIADPDNMAVIMKDGRFFKNTLV